MNNLSNRTKGILFLVFSAFGFAVMSAFVKLAGDLPSFQKTFFRNLVSCIVALFFIIKKFFSLHIYFLKLYYFLFFLLLCLIILL